jgi:hypothetical protein
MKPGEARGGERPGVRGVEELIGYEPVEEGTWIGLGADGG